MKPKTLLFLQSVAHGLQLINVAVAGSTHVPPLISVGIAALCASLGYYLQNVGNETQPDRKVVLQLPSSVVGSTDTSVPTSTSTALPPEGRP